MMRRDLVKIDQIHEMIFFIRGQKVMLDSDLAKLYGVETKVLLQAVRRNIERFPGDFMFQLENQEVISLRSQIVTSNKGRGGRRFLPYAFTEQGVAMLSSVLNSQKAVRVNIEIIRAFVRMRQVLSCHKELLKKMEEMENKYQYHDERIKVVFDAIRQMMVPEPKNKKIGFKIDKTTKK